MRFRPSIRFPRSRRRGGSATLLFTPPPILCLTAGAGPQYTVMEQGGYANRWSLSARVQLNYKFAHSSLAATYEKFTSTGSGFFAGASTQAARLLYTRPLGRTWD